MKFNNCQLGEGKSIGYAVQAYPCVGRVAKVRSRETFYPLFKVETKTTRVTRRRAT